MTFDNLEAALQAAGSPVDLLRNSQIGPYAFPVVRYEFTNWRDEQRSWRDSCALFDQSHHMSDLYVEGPDALKLFSDLGVNSFKNFKVNQAKQFVACNPDGYVIGDAILFYLDENKFSLVGRPPAGNWVHYNLETGKYNAKAERDERSAVNQGRRTFYRYQVQGPNAAKLIEKITRQAAPDIRFFNMGLFKIANHDVRALRHGMVGQPGFELFGPWDDGEAVKAAIVEAGQEFGLRLSGSRTYSSNTLESGWIPSPLPAVYTGEQMKAYRQWLSANSFEAIASLGGSFSSSNIEDYYLTPYDLGYGSVVKFDHDFIGREALEKIAANPRRRKVTLALNSDDVLKGMSTMFGPHPRTKHFEFPSAVYSTLPYDKVMKDGKVIGVSTWCGYSSNEGKMLTLAIINTEHSDPGTEVTFVWGEEGGGSSKPTVERHKQLEIRATVAPVPYAEPARTGYRVG